MGQLTGESISEALGCAKCCCRRQVGGLAMNSESGRRSAFHPEAIHTWMSSRPWLWNRTFEVDRTVFQLESS